MLLACCPCGGATAEESLAARAFRGFGMLAGPAQKEITHGVKQVAQRFVDARAKTGTFMSLEQSQAWPRTFAGPPGRSARTSRV